MKKLSILSEVALFVDDSFGEHKPHFERTLFWLLELCPDADEALQVAAYSHDIERAFKPKEAKRTVWYKGEEDLRNHQKNSGEIVCNFLAARYGDEKFAMKVKNIISAHEIGGGIDQNLIKDADSISYLEVNAPKNIEWLGEVSESDLRKKINWMFERITDRKAVEIARPFYEKAIEILENKVRQSK